MSSAVPHFSINSPFTSRFFYELSMLYNSMELNYDLHYAEDGSFTTFVTEWRWSYGDNSINIVAARDDNHVRIYINEKLVGKFSHDGHLQATHTEYLPVEEVHSETVDFIQRWCIWI